MDLKTPLTDDELAAQVYQSAAWSIASLALNVDIHPEFRKGIDAAADRCQELANLAEKGKA